jgi:signal transduction histidine kinase
MLKKQSSTFVWSTKGRTLREWLNALLKKQTHNDKEQTANFQDRYQETTVLLMEMAKTFINIPIENITSEIEKGLEKMGRFVNADRVYTFEYDWEKQVCNNTYEWCSEDISPEIDNLQDVPLEMMLWWVDNHKKGEKVLIPDVNALSPDDGVRQLLEPQGVVSLLTLPLLKNGECIGFIGFDSVREHHYYTQEEEDLLSVFAEIFVNIQNRQALELSLIAERNKAQESDKLKTAFINNINHEIRTPLNGILGFGNILAEKDLNASEKKDMLKFVQNSAKRLINTVTDYLDMATIVSGTINSKIEEIDLASFFERMYNNLKKEQVVSHLEIKLSLPHNQQHPTITTDLIYLTTSFEKLLDNAVKFTQEGSVTFGYTIQDDHFEFFVQDTGCGIEKSKQQLIFEMFSQADTSMTRSFEGSGLGLTIASELVKRMGGSITVQSEIGQGARFSFEIPVQPAG